MSRRVARLALLVLAALLLWMGPSSADTSVTTLPDGTYAYSGGGHSITVTCAGGSCRASVEGLSGPLTPQNCAGTTALCAQLFTGETPRSCPGGRPQQSYYFVAVSRERAQVTYEEPGDAVGKTNSTEFVCVVDELQETWPILTNTSLSTGAADTSPISNESVTGPFGGTDEPRDAGHLGLTRSLAGGGAVDAPSVLSSLPTMSELSLRTVLTAAGVTIVLVILTAIPTALLDSAAESGQVRLAAWRARRRGVDDGGETRRDGRWWWAALGVFLAAVISMFVDPHVGLNAGSVRMLGSIALSLAVEVVVSWVLVIWVVRRVHPNALASFEFRPLSLLMVVGAVVLSRVTGFEPGIVFGLVAGLGFVAVTTAAETAKLALTQLAWVFGLALVGWIAYSTMGEQSSAVGVFTSETLAGLAVGGFSATPIALFPLRGLGGHDVFTWSKRVWAVVYAIGLLGFLAIIMPMPGSWGEVSWSLTAWIAGYFAYLTVAIVAWAVLREGKPEAVSPQS